MSQTPGLIRSLKEGQMDFVGQAKAENFSTVVLWVCGLIGFVYGYIAERFLYTFLVLFAGLLFCGLVCVPSWPYFNRNRLAFQGAKSVSPSKKD